MFIFTKLLNNKTLLGPALSKSKQHHCTLENQADLGRQCYSQFQVCRLSISVRVAKF